MAALWNRADYYVFAVVSFFFFYSSPNLSGRCDLSANLQCMLPMSEMCRAWLTEKYRTQKLSKNRHLRTIAQLCRAISS